jgi:ABC-type dipeptide/oligopeptide/nickel transport system ATPase subunit
LSELLGARDLVTDVGRRRGWFRPARHLRAVDGVSFFIQAGEAYGVAGENGCGKTTLARTLLGLQRGFAGEILLDGMPVSGLAPAAARLARVAIQYVHQDPGAALDPWWRVGAILAEGLGIHGVPAGERGARIAEMLAVVGLDAAMAERYPHELSGGQQRRIVSRASCCCGRAS